MKCFRKVWGVGVMHMTRNGDIRGICGNKAVLERVDKSTLTWHGKNGWREDDGEDL